MSVPLRERVEEYLRLRRALGFGLVREGRMLAGFAAYLEQQGTAAITAEHAITWAQLPRNVHPGLWTQRLTAVRGFDLDAGLLPVRPAKSRCERVLPLHPSTVEALTEYDELRSRRHPAAATFLVSLQGTRLCHTPVMNAFREACAGAGVPGRPRIHDLRHSLAVTTLLEWYRSGENVDGQIPALQGYLGHVSPEGTYWYISAVPELMQLAAARAAGNEPR